MKRKKCSKCKKRLGFAAFGKHPRGAFGLQARCHKCQNAAHKLSYQTLDQKKKREIIDKQIRRRVEREQERKALALCIRCDNPPIQGKTCCLLHAKQRNASIRKRLHAASKVGLCGRCGIRQPLTGRLICQKCLTVRDGFWTKLRDEVQAAYGGCCQCCGERGKLFLTIDHMNNDGAEVRRQHSKGSKRPSGRGFSGHTFYIWLRKQGFPKDGFQLLCMQCNFGKKMNNGVCPHKTDPEGHPLPERR